LSGFKNAALEFNRLAKDANIVIAATKDAETYARFYFTAIADPLIERLMLNALQLKHKVEDYFFSNFSENNAERLYKKWWSTYSSSRPSIRFGTSSPKGLRGFKATLSMSNSSAQRTPQLDQWTLQIKLYSLCQIESIRTIYPHSTRS
jgi:hypothetical protein